MLNNFPQCFLIARLLPTLLLACGCDTFYPPEGSWQLRLRIVAISPALATILTRFESPIEWDIFLSFSFGFVVASMKSSLNKSGLPAFI